MPYEQPERYPTDFLPLYNAQQSLGSPGAVWKNLYVDQLLPPSGSDLILDSPSGNVTFQTNNIDRWYVAATTGDFVQSPTGGDIVFGKNAGVIRQNTSDAADTGQITVTGGGATGVARGGSITLKGNEAASSPGIISIDTGNIAGAGISLTVNNATGVLTLGTNSLVRFTIDAAGILNNNVAANESTGAGSALLGANSPAITLSAPFKWLKVKTQDGSTGYMPIWK